MQVGDRVKLILDKEVSPDNKWHGREGKIIDIDFDDAGEVTGDSEDNFMFKVELNNGDVPDVHFRKHDVKRIED